MKEHLLTLQVLNNKVQQIPTSIVQNDSDTNIINVSLVGSDNKPFSIAGSTVSCKILKETGAIAIIDVSHIVITDSEKGKLSITLPLLAVSRAGVCQGVIEIYKDSLRTSTARFSYLVTADIMNTAEQQIDVNTAVQLTTIAQNAISQVEAAKGAIQQRENSRVEAEGQRAANETVRVGAESSRASGESSRVIAETARVNAESIRASSESTRVSNENTRKSNETARASAENSRVSAETTRANSESTRESAETLRLNSESARNTAETARINAESNRVSNENSRGITETARVNAESARVTAEATRASAESTRTTNEADRAVAENARVSNETARIEAETGRKNAESERVAAEGTRATTFNSQMATIGSKTTTSINGEQANVNFIGNEKTVESVNGKKFASNTEIITTPTGVTEEERYTELLKSTCKEFISNGSPIVVNNGIAKQKVLSGTLQGQTVKCIYADSDWITKTGDGTAWNPAIVEISKMPQVKPSTNYVLLVEIKENTYQSQWKMSSSYGTRSFSDFNIEIGSVGIYKGIITSKSDLTVNNIGLYSVPNVQSMGTITFRRCLLEVGSPEAVNKFIPFGLSSTQAVVYNNNMKYSFYSTIEDKLANRVLDLGGLDGARNTWELKEDGSGVYAKKVSSRVTIDETSNIESNTAAVNQEKTIVFKINSYIGGDTSPSTVNVDAIKFKPVIGNATHMIDEEGISGAWTGIYIRIAKSKLTTLDVLGFKEWLKTNPIQLIYKLATPIVTTIPKELVPTILTQLQNQFTFGEGVAPSSVTIKLPTTDDIAKSYTVTLLNSWTQTPSTATPIVNLLNTGIVRLQMDLTAPSTTPNVTLFSLPLELRPITTQRVPVFINGVCVLATIDKTTGNVNLPSIPSANANVYIKTDYRRDI